MIRDIKVVRIRPRRRLPGYSSKVGESKEKEWPAIISPKGVVYGPIRNLRAFCREMGLEANNVRLVLSGEAKSSKGWRKATSEEEIDSIPWEPPEYEYYLESPSGEPFGPILDRKQLRKILRGTDLTEQEALSLLWGDTESAYGWTGVRISVI